MERKKEKENKQKVVGWMDNERKNEKKKQWPN